MKNNPLFNKNIISIKDLSKEELELILYTAERIKNTKEPLDFLKGKILSSLFLSLQQEQDFLLKQQCTNSQVML